MPGRDFSWEGKDLIYLLCDVNWEKICGYPLFRRKFKKVTYFFVIEKWLMQENSWENSKALLCESPQIDASSVAQNGRFVMNPVYPGGVTMLDTGEKSLDYRPSEMPKNALSRTFYFVFARVFQNIHVTAIRTLILVYSIPQKISWIDWSNCIDSQTRSWRFFCFYQSNSCFFYTDLLLMMKMVAESNIKAKIISKREISGRTGRAGALFSKWAPRFKTGELEHIKLALGTLDDASH